MSAPPEIALFFGHLHPLLVHLPIGLIVLLATLEVFARFPRFKNLTSNVGFILALTVPAVVVTAVCGFLLSLAGGYQDRLLQLHKWTGIGTAAVCLVAGVLYWTKRVALYRACLFLTVAALTVASHFGGSLTHGSDYLVRYAPAPVRHWLGGPPAAPGVGSGPATAKPVEIARLQAFGQVIQPILQKDCVACHGPDKSKAKLRLDSLEAVAKGGENGPVIIAGKGSESELLKRVRLPMSDDNHMPPEGKPQPSPDDIILLQWWVDAGAPANKTVGELKPPLRIDLILQNRFGAPASLAKSVAPRPLHEILPLAQKTSEELDIVVGQLAPKDPWLQCNARMAGTNFDDAALKRLEPLAPNLRWLDLGGTAVTDAGLVHLAGMQNLTRLHLERTRVTDAGLAHLASLQQLQYLDLYGTQITDAGLETLAKLPNLKQLFVWETKVSPAAAKTFVEARTDKDQLEKWQEQIQELQAQIRGARVSVELGSVATNAASAAAAPINAQCPVSGKPINPAKTVTYQGRVVAFCCDDCKAEFEKDPARFSEKIAQLTAKESSPSTATGK